MNISDIKAYVDAVIDVVRLQKGDKVKMAVIEYNPEGSEVPITVIISPTDIDLSDENIRTILYPYIVACRETSDRYLVADGRCYSLGTYGVSFTESVLTYIDKRSANVESSPIEIALYKNGALVPVNIDPTNSNAAICGSYMWGAVMNSDSDVMTLKSNMTTFICPKELLK